MCCDYQWQTLDLCQRGLQDTTYNKKPIDIIKAFCSKDNWALSPLRRTSWIGTRTREKMTITPATKGCMSCCFLVNSQKQKILGSTAVICCFLMCDSILQTRWRKITNRPSLEYRKSISLPLKNMSTKLHSWKMTYRNKTTGYRLSSMRT